MCLGAVCIGIGGHKGVFVTEKTRCIDKGIFTTCHEICGAAMAHIVVTNLAHACCFASSVCDGIDTTGSLPKYTLVMKYSYYNDDFRGLTCAQGVLLVPHSYRIFPWHQKTLEPQGFWGFHNCPVDTFLARGRVP